MLNAHTFYSYFRQLQSQVRTPRTPNASKAHTSQIPNVPSTPQELESKSDSDRATPSSVPSTTTRFSESEVPLERDDWWYKGTDNLFLNRSGEHRTQTPFPISIVPLLTPARLCGRFIHHSSGQASEPGIV